MSIQGDNQYPVVGQPESVMGYAVTDKPAQTAPAPRFMPATEAVQHKQTEVDRALVGLIQLDGVDFCGQLIMAMITPSEQLRREHLLKAVQPLERATSRLRELIGKIEERMKEASKK